MLLLKKKRKEKQHFNNVRSGVITSIKHFWFYFLCCVFCSWCSTPNWTPELCFVHFSLIGRQPSFPEGLCRTAWDFHKLPRHKAAPYNDSINLKCASMQILQKKSLLGDVTICSHNVARNTENDLLNLARPARGSRAMHTLAHKLFLCNKDNVSHITRHLQSHHSDRFI